MTGTIIGLPVADGAGLKDQILLHWELILAAVAAHIRIPHVEFFLDPSHPMLLGVGTPLGWRDPIHCLWSLGAKTNVNDAKAYFLAISSQTRALGAALEKAGFQKKNDRPVVEDGTWEHPAATQQYARMTRQAAASTTGLPVTMLFLDKTLKVRQELVIDPSAVSPSGAILSRQDPGATLARQCSARSICA